MASARRGQLPHPMRLSAAGPSTLPDLPPISALFLIDFDVKAGYTIAWKQAVPGLELEGVVEYKSLPSGLHTVKDDLIYFIHEAGHAGLSAFVNVPCDEADARNARMLAVGVLVPLSFGRLGRAWRHAERLKDMAAKLAADRKETSMLDAYWEQCKPNPNAEPMTPQGETPIASPVVEVHSPRSTGKGHSRDRTVSDGTAAFQGAHTLSPYHPARNLEALLDTFGPLVFPIHRAAVLRKRILISCHAPVHETCNFVYDLSVLSNIPQGLADLLPPQAPTHRLRPLFTIGVHDIPTLMEEASRSKQQNHREDDDDATLGDETPGGWIACTTDSILAMKDTLWDVLITMPPPFSANAAEKVWPTVECPGGQAIKATQRDLRRFRALKAGLARLAAATGPMQVPPSPNLRPSIDARSSTYSTTLIDNENDEALDKIVQPPTWSELAYGGFMWWASAGEQRRPYEHDEAAHDASLLADWIPSPVTPPSMPAPSPRVSREHMVDSVTSLRSRRESISGSDDEARAELAIIAFFHRLTTDILSVVGDAADADGTAYEDDESESEGDQVRLLPHGAGGLAPSRPVRIDSAAFEAMGLDVWNTADAEFIKELAELYFGRSAHIESKGVEVCGLRVC